MLISPEEWAIAKKVCTAKQLAALDLWRRGAGWKRIATVLAIDPSTARAHVRAGRRRIVAALESAAA